MQNIAFRIMNSIGIQLWSSLTNGINVRIRLLPRNAGKIMKELQLIVANFIWGKIKWTSNAGVCIKDELNSKS